MSDECHCFTLDDDRAKVLFCTLLVIVSAAIWVVDRAWQRGHDAASSPSPAKPVVVSALAEVRAVVERVGFIHCSRYTKLGKGTTRPSRLDVKLQNLCTAALPRRLDDDEFAAAVDALFARVDDELLQCQGILVAGDEAGVAASRLLSLIYSRRLSIEVLVMPCPCFARTRAPASR